MIRVLFHITDDNLSKYVAFLKKLSIYYENQGIKELDLSNVNLFGINDTFYKYIQFILYENRTIENLNLSSIWIFTIRLLFGGIRDRLHMLCIT